MNFEGGEGKMSRIDVSMNGRRTGNRIIIVPDVDLGPGCSELKIKGNVLIYFGCFSWIIG